VREHLPFIDRHRHGAEFREVIVQRRAQLSSDALRIALQPLQRLSRILRGVALATCTVDFLVDLRASARAQHADTPVEESTSEQRPYTCADGDDGRKTQVIHQACGTRDEARNRTTPRRQRSQTYHS